MGDVFRVMRIRDNEEVHRSVDLIGACVRWVKNAKELRVEQLAAGSTVAQKEVPAAECCAALRRWLPSNPYFMSEEEKKDMADFIREACEMVSKQKSGRPDEPTFNEVG
jgi:hypothetical protein